MKHEPYLLDVPCTDCEYLEASCMRINSIAMLYVCHLPL